MKNAEAGISSRRGRGGKKIEDLGGGGGLKNSRAGGVAGVGGQYPITCHEF